MVSVFPGPAVSIPRHYTEIRLNAELLRRLQMAVCAPPPPPPVPLRVRKEQAMLTQAEKDAFNAAVQQLWSTKDPLDPKFNLYDRIVNIHSYMPYKMHSAALLPNLLLQDPLHWTGHQVEHFAPNPTSGIYRFLPWHRAYLHFFEEELRRIDPRIVLPYWDWTRERYLPKWVAIPEVEMHDIHGKGYRVTRGSGQNGAALPTEEQVRQELSPHSYTPMTLLLELGSHGEVHGWVGGTMNNIMVSPADPLFWMHHGNIDRVWSAWQRHNPTEHPFLIGSDVVMQPTTLRYDQLAHTHQVGYRYAVEDFDPPLPDHPLLTAKDLQGQAAGDVAESKAAVASRVEQAIRRRSAKARKR